MRLRTTFLLWAGLALGCTGTEDVATTPQPVPVPAPVPAVPATPAPAEAAVGAYYQETAYVRSDLEKMSLRELSLRRNTIYARGGNPFRKKWLNDYFSAQPWYDPLAATDFGSMSSWRHGNSATMI